MAQVLRRAKVENPGIGRGLQEVHQDESGCDRMTSRRKRLVRKMLSRRKQITRLLLGVTERWQCDQTRTTASLRDVVERGNRKYVRYSMLFLLLGIVYSASFDGQAHNRNLTFRYFHAGQKPIENGCWCAAVEGFRKIIATNSHFNTAVAQQHGHQTSNPTASPTPDATPSPSVSGQQTHRHSPEMDMPAPSPSSEQMNTAKPMASRSSSATEHMHGAGRGLEVGSLMVMEGDEMGIRVGSSERNVISMGAMGSGTSWQPSSGPLHMQHWTKGDWLLMFHYNLFAGVNRQGGPRGVTKFESTSWFMPMAYHKLGKGTLQLRGMFSAEPFTVPPGGSPLLFQTGETYKGQPLIDHQHPHDLFMELSAQYTMPLGERGTWFTYFGYPGEPALGPVTVFHRLSASENPSATLAHHLQDSTHISFGVLTTGFTYRWFKLEGSIFNGREPDENRYDFDAHKWNSRSARLWFMPNNNWAFQVSHGFLRSPENQDPEGNIRRTTASVQYNKPFTRGNWASTLVWGRNHASKRGETRNLNGYTAESTVQFLDKNYVYTRLELVDKDDLLRPSDRQLLGIAEDHPSFRIGAYTFGGVRDVWTTEKVQLGIGSDLTFYSKPSLLDTIYGNRPVSWKLFFRIRPGRIDMSMHGTHGRTNATVH
jgi:hypothetical protein